MYKGCVKVFKGISLSLLAQSCCMPSAVTNSSGFPQSISETHTRTTMVMPPSYATVNMPPPSITQAAPVVQQPINYQYLPNQYQAPTQTINSCAPMQSSQCQPMQSSSNPVQSYDPCNYNVQVPQQTPAKYTIAIPPAPAPQYTIALPQGNPPNYAVVQQQAPVSASVPVKLQAHQEVCE